MPTKKRIGGKTFTLSLGGYSVKSKTSAKKHAKKLREQGNYVRIDTERTLIKALNLKGRPSHFKTHVRTRYYVYYRKK